MKSLSTKTFQCGVTVQGLTTLSGTVYLTALTNTATWDYVIVGTSAQGQLYTRTYAQIMSDITSGIGLSGYVPTSRTLTINGVSYDLTANRSWTITTPYVSKLQHAVKAGVAINKGQAVYVTSADGTNMIVGLASNASEATSSKTMGLLDATVSTNGFANVVTEGLLAGLDTSTANAEGDPVWLGTGGNLIYGLTNKPHAPAHLVFIGIVTRKNNSNGEIFVKVQNGFELDELHNVDVITTTPLNNHLLAYDYATSLWKNKTLGTVIGGVTSQYVKGDGTLGSFPSIGGGGGVVYYLNGGVASGVGGYQQMSTAPVLGAGTDFSLTGNGLVCQFLTDANSPSLTLVPPGAWRIGVYASMGTSANNSKFYVEILKYDGSTFTAIGSSVATPESVVNGTNIEYYTTTVAVSSTVLTITDRIAIRIYAVDNLSKTMTIHTENGHLCDIATTFPSGLSSINGLTDPSQLLVVGSSGSDFNITSSVDTHTFNIPTASASNRGLLSAANWTTFNSKQDALTNPITGTGTTNYLSKFTGASALSNSLVFDNGTNVGIGTVTPDSRLHIEGNTTGSGSGADAIVHIKQNGAWNGNEPWALYVEGYSYLNGFRVNAYDAQRGLYSDAGELGFAVGGNSPISFTQNTSDYRMYIAPGGNIGIGTTTPYEKLEVSGAISATGSVVGLSAQGHSTTLAVQSGISFLYAVDWGAEFKPLSIQAKTISLETGTGSTTSRLFIDNSGNVGIGTISPSYKLQVNADGAGLYVLGANTAPYTQTIASFVYGGNGNSINIENQGGKASIQARAGGSTMDLLLNPAGSNVVIGTTTPFTIGGTAKVSIYADAPSTYGLSSTDAVYLRRYGVGEYQFQTTASGGNNGNLSLQSYGGNVGIGTTSPSYLLDVQQVIRSKYGSNEGGIYLGGTPAGVAYVAGAVRATPSPSYSYTGKLSFYTTTWGVGTDYGITEQMYIDVTGSDTKAATLVMLPWGGNVGIGTTSPAYKLDVAGEGKVTGKFRVGGAVMLAEPGTGVLLFGSEGGNQTAIYSASAEAIRINTAGNVGIGTTSPGLKLDVVSGTTLYPVLRLQNTDANGYSGAHLYSSAGTLTGHFGWANGSSTALSDKMYFGTIVNKPVVFTTNDTEKVRIAADGNVGIGTTSPGTALAVNGGTAGQATVHIQHTSASGYSGIDFYENTGTHVGSLWHANSAGVGSNQNAMTLAARTSGDKVYIVAGGYDPATSGGITVDAGNVGIGTTAPTNRLQIGSTGSSGYGGNDLVIGNGTQVMAFYQSATVSTWYTNTSFSLMSSGSGSVGNVGIGTLTPSTKLDVSGVITATGGNSTNWNTAYGWGNHSSAGYVPQARTLTINGTSYDLSANRSWTIATTTPGGSDTQFQYNSSGSLAGASALTYNSTTNRIGINQASPGYDLDVNGQVRVQDKLRVGTVNSGNGVVHMSSTATINANTTTIVWAQNVSVGMCAFIEYYILNGNTFTDQRAGTIIVTWNQTGTPTIAHTETTTPDIGSTTTINFTSTLVGSDARINAVSSSPHPYTMVMSYKYF